MTPKQIERAVSDLTKRVQQIHNGDFVSLSFHSGAWSCSSCFTGIRSGACKTPTEAVSIFTAELRRIEGAKQAA